MNAALDFCGRNDLVFKKTPAGAPSLYPQVDYAYSVTFCSANWAHSKWESYRFLGLGDRHGVYFAKCVYNKGM